MTGITASTPSSGTEAQGTDTHYLVFAPATPPVGRETDTPLEDAFAAFAAGRSHSLDLILRVSNPEQIRNSGADYWLRVRVYPNRSTIQRTGHIEMTFSGVAFQLDPKDQETGPELHCTASLELEDRISGSRIGELTLNTGGNA